MTDPMGGNSRAELKALIERVENIETEQKALAADKKDVYGEAKARGFDPRTMRKVVAIRKMEKHVFAENRALEDTYLSALGLLDD